MGEERTVREAAARCRNALDQAGQALAAMRAKAHEWNGLVTQAQAHEARSVALAEELAEKRDAADGLRDRIADLEGALRTAEGRAGALQAELEEARREIRALHARRKEDQERLQRLRSALGDLECMAASVFGAADEGADAFSNGDAALADAPEMASLSAFPGRASRPRMGEWLFGAGRLPQSSLDTALDMQRGSHERLGRILVRMGAVSDEDVAECLAHQFGVPFERLNGSLEPDSRALAALPARAARAHSCLPLRLAGGALAVAMANPQDLVALDEIRRLTGREVAIAAAPEDAVLEAIKRGYGDLL